MKNIPKITILRHRPTLTLTPQFKIKFIISFYFLAFPFSTNAQEMNLEKDTLFFANQTEVLSNWLEDSGLGPNIVLEDYIVEEQKFTLYFQINYSAADSAYYGWQKLKKDFLNQSGFQLEDRLFLKCSHIFDLKLNQLFIRVKNKPILGEIPVVDVNIHYDKTKKDIILNEYITRSEVIDSIQFYNYNIKEGFFNIDTINFKNLIPEKKKEKIYTTLFEAAKAYFSEKHNTQIVKTNIDPLSFYVINIKYEVVNTPSKLSEIYDPTEMLTYTLSVLEIENGLKFYLIVDGKYGSGLFRSRAVNKYRDMNPKFEEELKLYIKIFLANIVEDWVNKN